MRGSTTTCPHISQVCRSPNAASLNPSRNPLLTNDCMQHRSMSVPILVPEDRTGGEVRPFSLAQNRVRLVPIIRRELAVLDVQLATAADAAPRIHKTHRRQR